MKIAQGDYGRIGHLLDEDNLYLPMLRSALEVYVDDEALRSAFVMSRLGWACFLGEEDCGGFREEVLEVVRRQPGGRYWFGGAPFWRAAVPL